MSEKKSKKRAVKIIDWIVLIIAILVVFGFIYKITNGNITISGPQQKTVKIRYVLEVYPEDLAMLDHIKVGDQITEAKKTFQLFVTDVKIVPYESRRVTLYPEYGKGFKTSEGIGIVTIEGTVPLKGLAKSIGLQEVSPGNRIFLESRLYKLSSRVMSVEELDD